MTSEVPLLHIRDDKRIMRDIHKRNCKTHHDYTHVIREYYMTNNGVQSCYNRIFTNGWISVHGRFVYINKTKQDEWIR